MTSFTRTIMNVATCKCGVTDAVERLAMEEREAAPHPATTLPPVPGPGPGPTVSSVAWAHDTYTHIYPRVIPAVPAVPAIGIRRGDSGSRSSSDSGRHRRSSRRSPSRKDSRRRTHTESGERSQYRHDHRLRYSPSADSRSTGSSRPSLARSDAEPPEEAAAQLARMEEDEKQQVLREWLAEKRQEEREQESTEPPRSEAEERKAGNEAENHRVKGNEERSQGQREGQVRQLADDASVANGHLQELSLSHSDRFLVVAQGVEDIMVNHQPPHNAYEEETIFRLRTLLLEGSTQPLRRIMLCLVDAKAQHWLDAFQMVLDSDPSNARGDRGWFLKALLHLSSKSELYPGVLQFGHQVQKSDQPFDAGSFGEVFRGRVSNREVAVKVFKVYQSTNRVRFMKAIRREAILWCHLHHVNVLPCYGIHYLSNQSHQVGLVSPWMGSGNIERHLLENPSFNRLLLISDIASGVAYLHENDIVHGDLKGANILVSAEGRACLADFGLSVLACTTLRGWTSVLSTSPNIAGTVRWQAPELLHTDDEGPDAKMSPESDIYSFACVCYEIMIGRIPFYHVGHNWSVPMQVIAGKRPTKPTPDEPAFQDYGLTEALWAFIEACWDQKPVLRPTAQQILQNVLLTSLVDPRSVQQWGGTSAADFRQQVIPPSTSKLYPQLPPLSPKSIESR